MQKQVCAAHCATRLSSSRCSLLLCTHSSSRANYIIRHFYFYSDFNFICLLPESEPEWGRGRESKCTAKSVLRLCSSAVDVIVVIIACCALTSLSGVASASVGVAAALPLSLSLFLALHLTDASFPSSAFCLPTAVLASFRFSINSCYANFIGQMLLLPTLLLLLLASLRASFVGVSSSCIKVAQLIKLRSCCLVVCVCVFICNCN